MTQLSLSASDLGPAAVNSSLSLRLTGRLQVCGGGTELAISVKWTVTGAAAAARARCRRASRAPRAQAVFGEPLDAASHGCRRHHLRVSDR